MYLNLFGAFAIKEAASLTTDMLDLQDIAASCFQLLDSLADVWKAAGIRQLIRDAYIYRDAKPEAEVSGVDVDAHATVLLLEGLDWLPDVEGVVGGSVACVELLQLFGAFKWFVATAALLLSTLI